MQENAHFIVVDMMLEVLEGVKWNLSFHHWTSTMDTHRHADYETCTHRHTSSAEDSLPREHEVCRHTQGCGTSDARQENNKRRRSDEDVKMLHDNTHTPEDAHVHQHAQDTGEEEIKHQPKTFSVLSTDSGFEGNMTPWLTSVSCVSLQPLLVV